MLCRNFPKFHISAVMIIKLLTVLLHVLSVMTRVLLIPRGSRSLSRTTLNLFHSQFTPGKRKDILKRFGLSGFVINSLLWITLRSGLVGRGVGEEKGRSNGYFLF